MLLHVVTLRRSGCFCHDDEDNNSNGSGDIGDEENEDCESGQSLE
jgi:hypothetical protein